MKSSMAEDAVAISEDRLLGGRVILRQPVDGFRAAIDPVLLAAAVPASSGQNVLELGTGTGAAALCLARRVEGVRVAGLDQQRDLVRLAGENARLNGLERQADFMVGDLLAPPMRLMPGGFDHVMANPPYLEAGTATLPPITLIHRADRLDALLASLVGKAGEITVFPLWPGEGKPAKRVIVRARRGIETPLKLAPGLVLHEPGGKFTAAADSVLRDGAALVL